MANNPIHIKESKKGSFTKAAKQHGKSVKEFEKQVLANPDDYSPAMRKKAQFSKNARGWDKAQTGISLSNNFQQADQEVFRNFQMDNQQLQYVDNSLNAVPIPNTQMQGYKQNPSYGNNYPQPHQAQPYRGEYGQAALAGLLAVDAFLPNAPNPYPISQPGFSDNPRPYGNGDLSIAQNGGSMAMNFKRPQIPLSYQEQQDQNAVMKTSFQNDPNKGLIPPQNFLNPQQQYFYNALNNTGDISSVYKGFNEELVGFGSEDSRSVRPNSSPFTGSYMLSNEDKQLLGDEYVNYSQKFKGDKNRYFNDLRQRGGNNPILRNLIEPASVAFNTPFKNGGKLSNTGYKFNSPDFNEPYLTIPSGDITMNSVPFPVYGQDNLGYSQMMYPGNDYQFPGDSVQEIPIRRMGGKMKKCKSGGKLNSNYQIGQSYDLSDKEIKDLTSQGWEIEIL